MQHSKYAPFRWHLLMCEGRRKSLRGRTVVDICPVPIGPAADPNPLLAAGVVNCQCRTGACRHRQCWLQSTSMAHARHSVACRLLGWLTCQYANFAVPQPKLLQGCVRICCAECALQGQNACTAVTEMATRLLSVQAWQPCSPVITQQEPQLICRSL